MSYIANLSYHQWVKERTDGDTNLSFADWMKEKGQKNDHADDIDDEFKNGEQTSSPIILDLDGNGVQHYLIRFILTTIVMVLQV